MGSTALWLMLLLGAYHGINPGMGWLFAVALGMQEQKGSAVAKALVPIALGHALAIGSRGAGCRVSRHGAAAGSRSATPSPRSCSVWESFAWCGIATRAGSVCRWASAT